MCVCLFPNSAETTDPNKLKFCGMISLRMGGYRLKNIQVWSTVCQKSSFPKESSSRYSHFASIVMQARVILNAVKNTNSRKSKNYPSEFFTPYTRMNFTNFHPFLTVIGQSLSHIWKKGKFDGIAQPRTSTNLSTS